MASNEDVQFLESFDGKTVNRRSIFDVKEPELNSTYNTTINTEKLTVLPVYPLEYVEKVVNECVQWKKLWKDSIAEGRHMKTHIAERKAAALQDSSFLKEVERLDSFEADFMDYLKIAQHFCNQKKVERRMNE